MLFKTRVNGTLKYCITWLNWDPTDLAMVTKSSLINYSDEDLKNVKTWSQYKKEIGYSSTFENYAKDKKINLTCSYELPKLEVIEHDEIIEMKIPPPRRLQTRSRINLAGMLSLASTVVLIILHFMMLFIINNY